MIFGWHERQGMLISEGNFTLHCCKKIGASFCVARYTSKWPELKRAVTFLQSYTSYKPQSAYFHTFRHSAASIVNQETGNLKLTQKFLGHSNLSTTLMYKRTPQRKQNGAQRSARPRTGDLWQSVPNCSTNWEQEQQRSAQLEE
jgi:hypothetical protein